MKLTDVKIPGVGSGSLASPAFWLSIIGGMFALLVAWGAANWLKNQAGQQVAKLRNDQSPGATGGIPAS